MSHRKFTTCIPSCISPHFTPFTPFYQKYNHLHHIHHYFTPFNQFHPKFTPLVRDVRGEWGESGYIIKTIQFIIAILNIALVCKISLDENAMFKIAFIK